MRKIQEQDFANRLWVNTKLGRTDRGGNKEGSKDDAQIVFRYIIGGEQEKAKKKRSRHRQCCFPLKRKLEAFLLHHVPFGQLETSSSGVIC